MVHSDWDSAPRYVCGPNFIYDLIWESPNFPAVRLLMTTSPTPSGTLLFALTYVHSKDSDYLQTNVDLT